MRADDPRHGERRGYYAHRRDGEEACESCKRAAAAAEARYAYERMHGLGRRVSPLATKRRLRALFALGWTWGQIAERVGTSRGAVEKWANEPRRFFYAGTAHRVAEVYDRMSAEVPEGWVATRTRNQARRRGYAPPLAWDDIEDPTDTPHGMVPDADDDTEDEVLVERILAGERRLRATPRQRQQVIDRWLARGGSQNELERLTGWNVARELRQQRKAS